MYSYLCLYIVSYLIIFLYYPASAWHTSIFCVWGPVATQQGKPSQILSRVDHQEKIITQLGDKRPQDKPSNYTLSKNAKSADLGVLVVVVGTRGENIGGPIVSMRNGGCDMSMRRALSCFQFMIRSLECLQHASHNTSHWTKFTSLIQFQELLWTEMYDLRIGLIFICTLALLSSFGHWMPEPAEDGTFEPFGPLDHHNHLSKISFWEIFSITLKIALLDILISLGSKDKKMWYPS